MLLSATAERACGEVEKSGGQKPSRLGDPRQQRLQLGLDDDVACVGGDASERGYREGREERAKVAAFFPGAPETDDCGVRGDAGRAPAAARDELRGDQGRQPGSQDGGEDG